MMFCGKQRKKNLMLCFLIVLKLLNLKPKSCLWFFTFESEVILKNRRGWEKKRISRVIYYELCILSSNLQWIYTIQWLKRVVQFLKSYAVYYKELAYKTQEFTCRKSSKESWSKEFTRSKLGEESRSVFWLWLDVR